MEYGTLYLVATPIGNLEDITLRALRILREVDLIAAEDTRKTLKLLNHFEISKPLTSFFRHNESRKGEYIISLLKEGKNVALVSDAGTPAISDPGEELVGMAIEEGILVSPIPGPVAAISALIVSGQTTGRFVFEGFIPMNKRGRKERLKELEFEQRTMIFYEAPHKLKYTLEDMFKFWGNRKIVLAREITKIYEEIIRTDLKNAIEKYNEDNPKGEFVIVVEGSKEEKKPEEIELIPIEDAVNMYIEEGLSKMDAMKKVAQERGISKREVYSQLNK